MDPLKIPPPPPQISIPLGGWPPYLNDLPLRVGVVPRPEEVGTGGDGATLVGLLEETRGGHGTVGPQRLVILIAKAVQLLKGAHDERNGRQLGTGVGHFFLIETEGLKYCRKSGNKFVNSQKNAKNQC